MIEVYESNLIIETEKFIRTMKIHDIIFFKADGCYTEINMISKEKILITETLKAIQQNFQNNNFFRCHRSYMINMQYFIILFIEERKGILCRPSPGGCPARRARAVGAR